MTRPDNLPTALAVAHVLADQFPGGCHLLIEDSPWWQRVRWESFRSRFAAVHTFQRIATCRGLRDLPRVYRAFAARQRAVAALPFAPERDLIVCIAGVTTLANAVGAACRGTRRVLCRPRTLHEQLHQPPDRRRYRFTTAGWLQYCLLEPLAGLERTLQLKPRVNRGGDGVRLNRLAKSPEEIYDAVIVLSNTGTERPAGAGERTLAARFPDLNELAGSVAPDGPPHGGADRRRVVFFGTPFLLVRNLPPDLYAARLNECLDFLRRSYPDCAWVYRPHPAETDEAARLRLDGFQIETDGEVAELYFLRHFARIAAVYSVSSTVSRVALNFGLEAYGLWRCFPFAETQARFFEGVMGAVPPEFDVRDLSAPPQAYAERRRAEPPVEGSLSLGEALRSALEVGTALRSRP